MARLFDLNFYLRGGARICSPLIAPLDRMLSGRCEEAGDYFPVFIVGAPRSGSTILYQLITHAGDCLFIDNCTHAFYQNLSFGVRLSRLAFSNRPHGSFESRYGNTGKLHAPSECGAFWYQFFPRGIDYVEAGDIAEHAVDEMRGTINGLMSKYRLNFVFKNLNAGQRTKVLLKAFPNARFIHIRRQPFFTIQSLIQARRKQGIPDEQWWSVRPQNFRAIESLPFVERQVAQVYYLEKQIHQDLGKLPPWQSLAIDYTAIPTEFERLLNVLEMPRRTTVSLSSTDFTNTVSVDSNLEAKIRLAMKRHDWKDAGYVQ